MQEGIDFSVYDNHVRCLAHIINLAVQQALAALKATMISNKDEIMNHNEELNEAQVIMKVNLK